MGINLNPDKVCNFNCIYCQVDRDGHIPGIDVDIQSIYSELKEILDLIKTGRLFSLPPFDRIPPELRHLSDIAISGDGEPTTSPDFYEAVEEIVQVKLEYFNPSPHPSPLRGEGRLSDDIKTVLITNASGLSRPKVQDAIDLMYKLNGEVWTKLDAGSDTYYRKVSRSNIPLRDIIRNILSTAMRHPVVIQSCFNKIGAIPPPPEEIGSYCLILKEIVEGGGKIRLVQIYTVARPPAEDYVTPLSIDELNLIAQRVQAMTKLPTEIFC